MTPFPGTRIPHRPTANFSDTWRCLCSRPVTMGTPLGRELAAMAIRSPGVREAGGGGAEAANSSLGLTSLRCVSIQ